MIDWSAPASLGMSTCLSAPPFRCVDAMEKAFFPQSIFTLQDHVGLFVRQSRGGVGLPVVLTGGGDHEEEELLRPETDRLVTQLESVLPSLWLVTCDKSSCTGPPSGS